jgi:hypothetical protein
MKCLRAVIIIVLLFFSVSVAYSADNQDFSFRKDPELKKVKPKKPVKIKLKRTATGKYTWDLTGDNVDEIIKIDTKLRKLLNLE